MFYFFERACLFWNSCLYSADLAVFRTLGSFASNSKSNWFFMNRTGGLVTVMSNRKHAGVLATLKPNDVVAFRDLQTKMFDSRAALLPCVVSDSSMVSISPRRNKVCCFFIFIEWLRACSLTGVLYK